MDSAWEGIGGGRTALVASQALSFPEVGEWAREGPRTEEEAMKITITVPEQHMKEGIAKRREILQRMVEIEKRSGPIWRGRSKTVTIKVDGISQLVLDSEWFSFSQDDGGLRITVTLPGGTDRNVVTERVLRITNSEYADLCEHPFGIVQRIEGDWVRIED